MIEDGYQIVTVEVSSRSYEPITVQSGIPVKVNFHVEEGVLNGCNNAIMIPEYEIQLPLEVGDNIIEFTPDKTGVIPYSVITSYSIHYTKLYEVATADAEATEESSDSGSGEKVKITYAQWGNETETVATQKIADKFNSEP